ncbi:DEAD/DEAH box helicase family protein [Candidatus Mycalebacterium sp.]
MNEAEVRVVIDALLRKAGWRLPDEENPNVRMEQFSEGRPSDYLLLGSNTYPIAILEAKESEKNPLSGKEQARGYAENHNARFVILSNSLQHYLWDLKSGNPQPIMEMPTQESLERVADISQNPSSFENQEIGEDYIVRSQRAGIPPESKRSLRDYQMQAVEAVKNVAAEGETRYLLEMATGAGKTLIAAAVIKMFLKSGNAKRVLFLVDRLELEDQAQKDFTNYLSQDFTTVIYKEKRDDWRTAQIVVSTVQTLAASDRYRKQFFPLDFDLLIVDEAHRSIGGRSGRAVFEYFLGYKLGLTATPKDYMRGVDAERENFKALEARLLRDTYNTFGCGNGEPTFRYTLNEGAEQGYLIQPRIIDTRTEVTTQLLSEKGADLVVKDRTTGEEEEGTFFRRDYERNLFSEETNRSFCKAFMDYAECDPISGEIGKTIVYCVSQNHAARITQIFNELAEEKFPGRYQSGFAVQVTSSVQDAREFSRQFAENNLQGRTLFLEGYRSSRARVCVTVGMMTTGYDCRDILNLCIMRPIFSPSEFIQIKGRGTRIYTFKYRHPESGEKTAEKEFYKLFDFFAVCEYFEKDHQYDEKLEIAVSESGSGGGGESEEYEGDFEGRDPVRRITETVVGSEGLRVDRELFAGFRNSVKKDDEIRESVESEDWDKAVNLTRERYENKPDDFISPEKIAVANNLDRLLQTREVLEFIFGVIDKFKDRRELLIDEAQKGVAAIKPDEDEIQNIFNALMAVVDSGEVREIIKSGQFGKLADNPALSSEQWLKIDQITRKMIIEYVRDYVPLEIFTEKSG